MASISEIKLKVASSLLGDKSVLYLSNGECPSVDRYIKKNLKIVSEGICDNSYKFVYLPELLSRLSADVRSYLFPGLTDSNDESVIAHVQTLFFKGEPRNGFVRKKDGEIFFHELPESDTYDIRNIISEYSENLADEPTFFFSRNFFSDSADDGIRYRISESETHESALHEPSIESLFEDDIECSKQSPCREIRFSKISKAPSEEEPLDPKTKAILSEIEKIQQRFGVTIEELELMLGYQVQLSHLHITHSNKIILTDFDNKEIKLDHLSKALFFLYLKHPEGIRYKELMNYRNELLELYLNITGKDNLDEIHKSIDDLVNPMQNAINVKVSRVKAAFKSAVSDRVAKFYYIDGMSGEAKKIHLDRDYVIWKR